jgi:hypothetical protein
LDNIIALFYSQAKIILFFALMGLINVGTLYLTVTLLECFTIANIIHQRQKKLLLMPSKQVIKLHKPYSFFGAKFTDQYRTVQILMKILKDI